MVKPTIGFARERAFRSAAMLLAVVFASGMIVSPLPAQTPTPPAKPAQSTERPRYYSERMPSRVAAYYEGSWGIDSFSLKAVESGELIRFTYRVADPEKARAINNKGTEAFLDSGRVRLTIPSLEKVGQLRQSSTPIAGTSYWMAFSNPGRQVRKGDRVNIVIGQFRADGLVVE
jgi:hypothetical protein